MGPLGTFARVVHVLAAGIVLGGAVFVAVVLPSLHDAELSAHGLAVLIELARARIDQIALVGGPVLFLSLFAGFGGQNLRLRLRALAALGLTGLAALGLRWFQPGLESARAALGRPLSELPADDAYAVAYRTLDTYAQLGAAVMAVLALYLLASAMSASPRRRFGGIEL